MNRATLPFFAACLGIALFAGMDAVMKGLAIAMGAYAAMLWRQLIGAAIALGPWLATHNGWPRGAAMRFHLMRGAVGAAMATTWFYGLARVPMAEAVALSFIAPLIALYLASLLLGETVRRSSVIASLLGVAGVAVLLGARLVQPDGTRALDGVIAILVSAVLYAWNIILMRQQALVAKPAEVAFFQSAVSGGWLWLSLPVVLLLRPEWFVVPTGAQWPLLALGALLTVASLFLLSWAYGRAEANILVPVEYTAFVWLAILGAIFYDEAITITTLIGAVLIVTGCIIAARGGRAAPVVREAAA
ncbi:MAG: DMT family transporter [Sphingomonadaceae bacterium]